MNLNNSLRKLMKVRRKEYHPLIRQVHKKHNIAKRTLFYVKENCSDRNVISVILTESLKILILASILSSVAGFGLENLKQQFITILPLLILFPVLNGLGGNYGIIFSSKYSTMIHEGKIKHNPFKSKELRGLLIDLMVIGVFTALIASIFSLVFAGLKGFATTPSITSKIILIAIIDILLVSLVLFLISVFVGNYVYKKREDPNNFLIPISTSAADFLNILILVGLIILFF